MAIYRIDAINPQATRVLRAMFHLALLCVPQATARVERPCCMGSRWSLSARCFRPNSIRRVMTNAAGFMTSTNSHVARFSRKRSVHATPGRCGSCLLRIVISQGIRHLDVADAKHYDPSIARLIDPSAAQRTRDRKHPEIRRTGTPVALTRRDCPVFADIDAGAICLRGPGRRHVARGQFRSGSGLGPYRTRRRNPDCRRRGHRVWQTPWRRTSRASCHRKTWSHRRAIVTYGRSRSLEAACGSCGDRGSSARSNLATLRQCLLGTLWP